MGNKLENVKRNVETAESIEQNGLEQGEKDGQEDRAGQPPPQERAQKRT